MSAQTSNKASLRDLIVRLGDPHVRRSGRPDDSEIGALHEVRESCTGFLSGAPRRILRYVGGGRWAVSSGSATLWHEDGGSVREWGDVPGSLRDRALSILDTGP